MGFLPPPPATGPSLPGVDLGAGLGTRGNNVESDEYSLYTQSNSVVVERVLSVLQHMCYCAQLSSKSTMYAMLYMFRVCIVQGVGRSVGVEWHASA